MSFVLFLIWKEIISLNGINQLNCVMVKSYVFSAVSTELLNII
jgi:hypothetical protein